MYLNLRGKKLVVPVSIISLYQMFIHEDQGLMYLLKENNQEISSLGV
jgi:hypothetical protein